MPFSSIAAAKKAGFPTNAEGVGLTLTQINKLAEIYDAIKKAGTAKNPFSVAWTQWKKLYKKVGDRWTEIKAAAIEFGTEQFTASSHRDAGIPGHAIQIEGRLIHLGTKTLKGWGITSAATEQIVKGFPGVPIRACDSQDPHACDFSYNDDSLVGYGTRAWVEDEWIMAAAAITDQKAAKNIDNGTWTPFGKGGWSVIGFPSKPIADFKSSGFMDGFQPAGISLILASTATPAYVGSGFEMVAAAIYDHQGGNMVQNTPDGGGDPVTYTQEQLDIKVKETLDAKIAEIEAAGQKHTTEELAKQKLEYDASLAKMTTEERASYEAKLTEMTPNKDVNEIIAAAVTKGQADTLEAIEKDKLTTEYKGMLTASVVLSAPYMSDGVLDQTKIDAKMASMQEMKVAAITGLIDEAKMMTAAATPAQSAFDAMEVPGTPPGASQEAAELAICDRMG